ncbi:unnamed protein product (macronuclear) [Paramecium tetraurelia]|uniref:Uncharacterized protein n=1 Tax=Paramecium tetraurelia TaxID=5888 RepID=A0DFF6_PARTE|nr:uncharacterized protein GSPATT00016586001 [Paramecium tetraurelia]CAK81773.1 unnamed protein product [Paramecium tetraurelia]|eukprot:XP_001449170.1 hypothetical protein (macronuclear) [Paramecium tetraurelia strain d4-2]
MNPEPITYSSLIVLNMSAFPNLSLYSNGFSTQNFNLRSFHQLRGDLDQDYQNCVFRILPVLNYKAQDDLLCQFKDSSFNELEKFDQSQRKHKIQTILHNLENELTSNISLTKKLAGTPLVFSSSIFHLVHVSSLKFLALDDQNLEALQFKLIDFPNNNTLLKFNPCLNFQKLRTNQVYSGDVVCISANKQVCNRTANLFTDYWGLNYYELQDEPQKYDDEVGRAKVIASVEDQTQWRIKIFQTQQDNDEALFVGDVAIFHLPELNLYLTAKKTQDIQEKVKEILDRNSVDDISNIIQDKLTYTKQQTLFPGQQAVISRQVSEEVGRNESRNYKSDSQNSHIYEKQRSMQSRSSQVIQASKNIREIDKALYSELKLFFSNFVGNKQDKITIPFSAYWRIESDNFTGGEVKWDKCYRIRHFQTGQYLDVNIMRQVKLTEQVTKNTLFQFVPVKKNSKFVDKESYFLIKHFLTGSYLNLRNEPDIPYGSVCITQDIDLINCIRFRKTDYEDIWEKRFLVFLVPILKEAISYFEIVQPLTSIACMKKSEVQERIEFYYLFEKLNSLLEILNQFMYNKLVSNIQTTQDFSFVSQNRQDILREENILPLLIWLICTTFPNPDEKVEGTEQNLISDLYGEHSIILRVQNMIQQQLDKTNDAAYEKKVQKLKEQLEENHRKRKRLLQLKLFQTIKIACHNNQQNQEILMKYFKHFEKQITHDYICTTICQCITNNYQILSQLNKQEIAYDMKFTTNANTTDQKNQKSQTTILSRLLDVLSKNDQLLPDLMHFLSETCEANGEPVFNNQEYLLNSIQLLNQKVKNDQGEEKIYMHLEPIQESEGNYKEFYITYRTSNKTYVTRMLNDFLNDYQQFKDMDHFYEVQYNFLIEQLAFFSNICFHRNTAARELISKTFTYSILLSYAEQKNDQEDSFNGEYHFVNKQVRAYFFRMIRTLYIDREPYTTTPKPELVRILEEKTTQKTLFLFDEVSSQKHEKGGFDIQKLKLKMLIYLEVQSEKLDLNLGEETVYNLETLEIIKILELMLKFELFWKRDVEGPIQKKNSHKRGASLFNKISENGMGLKEIDRLITVLAKILEYDHQYFKCLANAKIKRNWQAENEKDKGFMKFNISGISQVFEKETKEKDEQLQTNQNFRQVKQQDTEVVNDSLFKKMKNLKKVLQRYNNKTFTLRENKEEDYQVLIKIQICQIFSYLMDVSQDYWIDNAIEFYKSLQQNKQLNDEVKEEELIKLFPEEILMSGEQWIDKPENERRLNRTSAPVLKTFDEVLRRPFIEVLLISLYFSRNPQLENQIVELIQRFARQKKEFLQHFENIQILDTNESQQLFDVWVQMTQILKNNVQRSQTWITENNRIMHQTLQCLWKIDSIFQQTESVSLKLKQQIFEHIGGYEVLIELINKALTVIDQKSFPPDLIILLKHTMNIMAFFAKDNERNALTVYRKVVKKIIQNSNQNIGQISLICSLFEKKPTLYGQLGQQEYDYFIALIKQHGRYPEFLQFYLEIIKVTEIYSKKSVDMFEIIIEKLTEPMSLSPDSEYENPLYPFQESRKMTDFFDYTPNKAKYQLYFINIVSKCLSKKIRASLISQGIEFLKLQDLLEQTLIVTQRILGCIKQKEKPHPDDIQLQSDYWNIIKTMVFHKPESLDELMFPYNSETLNKILTDEHKVIKQKDQFIPQNLNYLFDSLLPVVNRYNELLQNALLSSEKDQHQISEFVSFFLENLDKMFFLAPAELTNNKQRLKTISDLGQSFNIQIPIKFFQADPNISQDEKTADMLTNYQITQENSAISQFRKKYFGQEFVKDLVKKESLKLSNSIWTIQNMFKDDRKQEVKDLLLTNSDIIVKILTYLEFWKTNGASRENIIFILKVLSAILKDTENELYERQVLFNRMNVTQILIVLLCESELEPVYMGTIMSFMILLLKNGNKNVQKTAYEYFLSNTQCEKFFKQLKNVFDIQILSMSRAHKLNYQENKLVCKALKLIQLFCEGHNQDLQNYMRSQSNQKNSFDLVSQIVLLLSTFLISKGNYESVLQCFETLTELIQGPCKQNQQALLKSNLLEYVVLILSEDEKIFEQSNEYFKYDGEKQYRLAIHPGQLARLKFKCLNCLVSLLECCDPQNSDIARLVRVIPLNVLTNNLTRVYKIFKNSFGAVYKDEMFKRAEKDITNDEPAVNQEFIIENGFYIFLLMQQFLGNQKAKQMLYEDNEMNDVLNEFSENNNKKEENAIANIFSGLGNIAKMGGNLIGQLGLAQKSEEELRQEKLLQEKLEQKELTKNAIKFFRQNTCSIDMIRDQKLYTIYFPKLPICNLPKSARLEFHDQVDRTSSKTKLTYLMERANFLIKVMEYEEKLNQVFAKNPIFAFFATSGKLWENCAFVTTLVINLIVLLSYSQSFYNESQSGQTGDLIYERLQDPRLLEYSDFIWTPHLIQGLGITMLVFSSLIVFFFLVKRAPLKVDHIWEDYQKPKTVMKMIWEVSVRGIKSLFILLQDPDILYYFIYIIAGIVGLTVHPFFFAFHLMDFLKLEQLKTVLDAIWGPRQEIGLALLLLAVVEYYVGILGFVIFFNDYRIVDGTSCRILPDNDHIICERGCSTMWQCIFISFDLTFKFTGALGSGIMDYDTITQITQNYDMVVNGWDRVKYSQNEYDGVDHQFTSNYFSRFVFDNAVNIVLVMIMLNMIQGIIVDTFGSLREKLQERIKDQTMKCFICGITREKFEKNDEGGGMGFQEHIELEHYMWNYIYYYAYLKHKDENDYNGNESYIKSKIDIKDISWMPIKRARFAEEDMDDQQKGNEIQEAIEMKMKVMNDSLEKIQDRMKHIIDIINNQPVSMTETFNG